jgi:hypothetical protein
MSSNFNKIVEELMECSSEAARKNILAVEAARFTNLPVADAIENMKDMHKAMEQSNRELEWYIRLKKMKQTYGWTDKEIAELAEYKDANSFRNSTRKSFPGLLKLAIQIFEKEQIAKA